MSPRALTMPRARCAANGAAQPLRCYRARHSIASEGRCEGACAPGAAKAGRRAGAYQLPSKNAKGRPLTFEF